MTQNGAVRGGRQKAPRIWYGIIVYPEEKCAKNLQQCNAEVQWTNGNNALADMFRRRG